MKKITSVLVLTLFILSAKAEGDDRKVRFGLTGSGSLSWIKPDNKYMKRKGLKAGYSYGLLLDLNMGKNYAFGTGLQVVNSGGGIIFANDTVSISVTDTIGSYRDYYWASSKYKYSITDIEIPISLKLKTNEIGYLTYFGQIGLVTNFRYKAKANWSYEAVDTEDEFGNAFAQSSDLKNGRSGDKVDVTSQINFFRTALLVQIGAEYNLTGNTSVIFGLAFKNGFSPFNTFSKKFYPDRNDDGRGNNDDKPKVDNATLSETSTSTLNYPVSPAGVRGQPEFSGPLKRGFTNQIVLNVGIFF